MLAWTGPVRSKGLDPAKLEGIVVDDDQAERQGFALVSTSISPFVGNGYRHDGDAARAGVEAVQVVERPLPDAVAVGVSPQR